MMLEHALLCVTPGREQAFEESMLRALPIITSAPECHGAQVRRQHENGSIYLLTVQWSTVEDHMAFRDTPLFSEWSSMTHPFYSVKPSVTHFSEPLEP